MPMETWSDNVIRYIDDISYEIVSKTGNPKDRYHLGKIILKSFKDDPNFLLQIDAATHERDTFGSMLDKSVRCAEAFRKLGIEKGDVIVVMTTNCLDLTAPMYACFYLGICAACIDGTLLKDEIQNIFVDAKPKFVLCNGSKAQDVREALKKLELNAEIATFGKQENFNTFPEFLDIYAKNVAIEDFQPAELDPEETTAVLVSTSGSTGLPKVAVLTHRNCLLGFSYMWMMYTDFPTPTRLPLILSPVQWLSAQIHFILSPILKYTRLQSSAPATPEHVYSIINKYKPTYLILSPTFMMVLLKPGEREKCDFTSLENILLGGSVVSKEVIDELKSVNPKGKVYIGYGITECTGLCFNFLQALPGSCGTPLGHFQYRLVDVETQKDINEANITGELWLKGPTIFKGYLNRPEETKQALTKDGWFKTGDMFYRDDSWNFYFVDRLKLLLKYINHQISPAEIETVIRKHPGVLDVAVTGIPDLVCGDLPVACVVTNDTCKVSAEEIKDLVQTSLTDTKQLRGGVIFLKQLPLTATGKVDRVQLKIMVSKR